ncbi:hypothetical protein [Erwinia typographi]|uniref:hypothetical protein n=1 Tax=Erwinia typographi TaxID=371042 RepID=UPI000690AAC1|nr:hypothetical protein [Erwinia typographi]
MLIFFVFFMFFSPQSFAVQYENLNEYSTPESVVNIFDNKLIVQDVKNLTKSKYNEFIGSYEAFADPEKLKDGGLLVDGWLRELRLENSSAMVIEPDGKLYLAWVVPDNNKINYMTNDKTMTEIQPDIQQWARRFDNIGFD